MTIDLSRARRETPGCRSVLHFDNAGAALMPQPVLDATIEHLRLEAEVGGYAAAERAQPEIERLEPPFLDLHAATWVAPDRYRMRDDARRFETWESNVAGKVGLGVAIDYALGWGMEAIRDRIYGLADDLRARLAGLDGVTLHDIGAERCGIVTFKVADVATLDIAAALGDQGINVATSSAASTLLDMQSRGLDVLVRASVHYYNSKDEIDRLCEAIAVLR